MSAFCTRYNSMSYILQYLLVNLYISQEKKDSWDILRYLCNSMTSLHKIWHDDAERTSEAHDC